MATNSYRSWLIAVAVALIAGCAPAQEIQVYEVRDFSGGWVNSVPNAAMRDNEALSMINFDVFPDGLHRRKGMSLHFVDGLTGHGVEALESHYSPTNKWMLTLRNDPDRIESDTGAVNTFFWSVCNPQTEECTTLTYAPVRSQRRYYGNSFKTEGVTINDKRVIATTGSEMIIFNGSKTFPARPRAAAQADVIALDGGGALSGTYTYTYAFEDTTVHDTSNLSPPSWPVTIKRGKALLQGLATPTMADQQNKIIFRRTCDTCTYYAVTSIHPDSTWFLDTFSVTTSNKPRKAFGTKLPGREHGVPPPGAITITAAAGAGGGSTIGYDGEINPARVGVNAYCPCQERIGYSVVFLDEEGRHSYFSSPFFKKVDSVYRPFPGIVTVDCSFPLDTSHESFSNDNFHHLLTDIPVSDNPAVTKKLLLRSYVFSDYYSSGDPCLTFGTGNSFGNATYTYEYLSSPGIFGPAIDPIDWYILDTLDNDSTTYTDNNAYPTGADSLTSIFCPTENGGEIGGYYAELSCNDDSLISFTPSTIATLGSRVFAAGDPAHKNYIYYAEFGLPTAWAPDKYISVPSQEGDWFTALLAVGNDRLLAFRQNSVYEVAGLSFFQFTVQEVMSGIGLGAPQSLAKRNNTVIFAHSSGVYELGSNVPLTQTIANSYDSMASSLEQIWGGFVDDEYWLSGRIGGSGPNNVTFVFSPQPSPHWKRYDFGVQDALQFDYDTLTNEFRTDRYILLRGDDSLYRWNYTADDTTDNTHRINAVWESKYFLEGPGRKKLFWVEIDGTGDIDSLTISVLTNLGEGQTIVRQVAPDFTDEKIDRFRIDAIADNFSIKLADNGKGNYIIHRLILGWKPWDQGRPE